MIIDAHTHIFPDQFIRDRSWLSSREPDFRELYQDPDANMVNAELLIEQMDRNEIGKSVIFGFCWQSPERTRRHNDYILTSVDRYPDRLIGMCCIDPRLENADRELERCLDCGMVGAGELAYYDKEPNDTFWSSLKPIMDISRERDCPVLIHTSEPVGHVYPGKTNMSLGQIYRFVKRFPNNKIILAHWGGGLFFYHLMKKEIKRALANVFFDTAASPFLYDPAIYQLASDIVGPEKILFGSDFPLMSPKRYLTEMKNSGVSQETIALFTAQNTAKLLKME